MPFTPISVREARTAAAYDGTNSADFNTAISDSTVVSENASGLTFTSAGQQYTVAPAVLGSLFVAQVTPRMSDLPWRPVVPPA